MVISIYRQHFTLLCFNIVFLFLVFCLLNPHTAYCRDLTEIRKTSVEQWRCCAGLKWIVEKVEKFRWNRPRVSVGKKRKRCVLLLFSPSGVELSTHYWFIHFSHCFFFCSHCKRIRSSTISGFMNMIASIIDAFIAGRILFVFLLLC